MSSDIIQLPKLEDVKKVLAAAKSDIDKAMKEEPEFASKGKFILQVIGIIEEKTSKRKDLDIKDFKEKIDIAAHLTFFQSLIEDIFGFDVDEDDEFDFDEVDEDEEEEEQPKGLPMKKSGGGCCGGHHHH